MKSFLAVLAIAMLVAMALVMPVRLLAQRLGAVSLPGGRHVHQSATPRLGGVAVFLAVIAPLGLLFVVDTNAALALRADWMKAVGLAVGGFLMCAVGVADDVRGLRALHKLGAQIVAGIIAFGFGFRIEGIHLPFLGDVQMGLFALPITVLWIVGIINAINLIDGLDGLAGGVAIFASITNFVVAYLNGSIFVALVMCALLGATLGFLFHNFNPARIFMGDSGSYFIGYVLAVSALTGSLQKASTTVAIVVPVLALGVPILDTLFAMVRRFLERKPLFSPDRGHIHHRLLDMGITHRRAVLIIYGVSSAFTAAAIAVALGRQWQVGAALLGVCIVLVALVRFVGYAEQINRAVKQRNQFRTREIELLRRAVRECPNAFATARDEASLWQALEAMLREAEIARYVVTIVEGPIERDVRAWASGDVGDRDLCSARFTIGEAHAARATIRFSFPADGSTVSPAIDILLQLAVDFFARELVRLEGAFAPESKTTPAPVAVASISAAQIQRHA